MLRELPGAARWLWRDGDGGLTEAMVRFAARHEWRATSRTCWRGAAGCSFSMRAPPRAWPTTVAAILADELGSGFDAAASSAAFKQLAKRYRTLP